ncbi:MAG: DNA polymerase I [Parcubacteria group bacterium Licking1014_17]|nr:MAG: DNA polymerase I [Parcubacteria group bacterium Licking1014_17]
MKKLMLIDGNALVHRAFHALPPLKSPKGILTNAVFGFFSILLRAIKDIKPDYIAATFDLAGPTFRHEEFAEYKSHRVKAPDELYEQMPIVKNLLAAFGVPVYEQQGYEADDIIGTLATKSKKIKDLKTIIATGDLDTLQLVEGDKTSVFTLKKGLADTVIYDEDAVIKRFGLNPSQMPDFKGLKGDPSDNIPGVPGVGDKTASELIKNYGDLDSLYKALEKGKTKDISEKLQAKLKEFKEQAYFSKQLSTIVCDLDVDFSLEKADWRKNADISKVKDMFRELGFSSLMNRLSEAAEIEKEGNGASKEIPATEQVKLIAELTEEKAKELSSKIKTVAVAADEDGLLVSPDGLRIYSVKSENLALEPVKKIFEDPEIQKIGHDLKPTVKLLLKEGIELKGLVFDSKIASYMLGFPIRDYNFSGVAERLFSKSTGDSAVSVLSHIFKVREKLEKEMEAQKMEAPYRMIEMPLIEVLAYMENKGVLVDIKVVGALLKLVEKEIAKLETKIYKIAGGEFNINSPQQVAEVLFGKLGIKGKIKKTGGGAMSTAAPELEKLRDEHLIIDLILQHREFQKLKTTYIEPFPTLIDPEDKRLHTTYDQTGTATGRLASQNPNLQNIPTRTELGQKFRKAFIAREGFMLVSFDYSQVELRIVAHIADDKTMIAAFERNEDIHTRTAAEVFDVDFSDVTKEMRRQAKVLNFGIIYGMGPAGFARAAGMDRKQANEFIEKYLKEFSGIAWYMDEMKRKVRKDGYVETLFGHRRLLPEIHSQMPQLEAQAERMAINMPTQGTVADIVKIAMRRIYDRIKKEGWEEDVNLLLQIHDELLFEIREKSMSPAVEAIKEIMEHIYQFKVPLAIDVKVGKNWADMEPPL